MSNTSRYSASGRLCNSGSFQPIALLFEVYRKKIKVNRKQDEKIWYNIDQIANWQLTEQGKETHFPFS